MRIFCIVCLTMGTSFALVAQTNVIAPTTETPLTVASASTNSPVTVSTATTTNAPTEVRPTEINSEESQFFMKSNLYFYIGNVRVDNPQMKLKCEMLTLENPKLEEGLKYNRATAETNVLID